ncbi:DUF2752 domain-containing protein [Phaeacidiphilus oryzae]|uniref:DUF2752 domain-containing protein n=1 Tax=Phaeacidiphilus oryzae TaxID=348818 RepID=UPI00056AD1E3|nr:DUF2752 domain-containing protein [Phaeacidiphilus oryzae]
MAPSPALRAPAALGAGFAAAVGCVAGYDPAAPGNHYPGCPLLALTGELCPACGGLRCVHAAAHGDLAAAAHDNLLVLVAGAFAVLAWARWAVRAARGLPTPVRRPPPAVLWAVAALVLVFTVLRNLPLPFGRELAP